jgi:hypothetical protein
MGLYNFKPRFVPFILDLSKRHTIRAKRRYPDKPGNTCHLFTGLRTKNVQLLMRAPCVKVEDIRISERRVVLIEGVALDEEECERLARCDGFSSFEEMATFWKGRLPFVGDLIHWKP